VKAKGAVGRCMVVVVVFILARVVMAWGVVGARPPHMNENRQDPTPSPPPVPSTPPQFTAVVIIGLANNPSSVKEGPAIADHSHPPPLVAGQRHYAAVLKAQRTMGAIGPDPLVAAFLQQLGVQPDPGWDFLAGQYYYNANSQKIRIDSTILGGFISTYSYYAFGSEWIYTFLNNANNTCQRYSLDQGSFPAPNWMKNAQFLGTEQVLGMQVYHWHGKGNHLGPDTGLNEYDYFVTMEDNTPVLISNSGFVQYFVSFKTTNLPTELWNYPTLCNL